ncbi:hypothetical protein [Pedobacter endophyticus]|uniref:Uncharacterized protein n=1 Tax=Pedobacter endophyticus TaxID=2789740 RepID=A0A7U3Q5C6_9SPHI|nr:hypothetical protein [Pedobacter endophyticus]QPH38890.1 hypothetical protein IZT61_17760 [Pedobacter endophyticus]
MNHVEKYKKLLEDIFNKDIDLKPTSITNNCIGALASSQNSNFRKNFIERLERLRDYYQNKHSIIEEIIFSAKNIGESQGYKWSGKYSELVALDFWTSFEDIPSVTYVVKENTDTFHDSIARKIGQQVIDLDLGIELAHKTIYTDVKSFIPIHDELTDLIIKKVENKVNIGKFLVGVDDVFDVDYLRVSKDLKSEIKGGLISKLQETIEQGKGYLSYQLKSGKNIKFTISYPKSNRRNIVLQTIREYDPYKLAEDYKYKILDYYNKLLITRPSLITWVINPWFNKELNNGVGDFEMAFMRSLARRIFMDLSKDDSMMSNYFEDFEGTHDISVAEISKLITGIIFIYDNSILGNIDTLYDSCIFLNPNASNEVLTDRDFGTLSFGPSRYRVYIDDFQHDCY